MKGGSSEFEDIESGGLGDGEGAKDVSDQIENEDQLEGAKQKGEEQEEADEDVPVLYLSTRSETCIWVFYGTWY